MDRRRTALIVLFAFTLTACKDDQSTPAQSAPANPPPVAQTQPPASAPVTPPPALPAQEQPVEEAPAPASEAQVPQQPPAPVEHRVTLSWQAPATRVSGDPLTLAEIAGFEIYFYEEGCGTTCESTVSVDKDTFTQAMTLSEEGLWHFAMAVIDLNGLKSELSNPVTVSIGS